MYLKNVEKFKCIECGTDEISYKIGLGKDEIILCFKCALDLKMLLDSSIMSSHLISKMFLETPLKEENRIIYEEYIQKVKEWIKNVPKFGKIEIGD
jgi:hypothetical protein